MDFEQLANLLTSQTFPVVVSLILLFRVEKTIERLNEQISDLTAEIKSMRH